MRWQDRIRATAPALALALAALLPTPLTLTTLGTVPFRTRTGMEVLR